ncbi:MAG: alpha/beta hydrolase [Gemmatimonadales bacterium]|nr:alpha/beta hydrolase [Candidatus Palauibacter irciniicola]MYC17324.1 alpha/beta hydrolase [Gemmatimonadales bacterium]
MSGLRWPGRFALGAAAGVAGVAWWLAMTRRNEALVRPPVRDGSGEALPGGVIEYSDGERVEYVDAGSGDALVWVPGADGPKETFRYQLPSFARRHRVVCADLRREFRETADFDRLVDDVAELVDARGVDRFVLIGTSLGSAITMRFASRFPERVRGIVLCNPLARVSYRHVGFNRAALIPLAMLTTRYLPTELSRGLARTWSRLGVWIFDDSPGRDALIEYALFTGPRTVRPSVSDRRVSGLRRVDLRTDLADIAVPALVVKGPRDEYCPVDWAREITELLPDAEYVPIPGTGHCSHISRPGAFNETLGDWLQRLRAREEEEEESVERGDA